MKKFLEYADSELEKKLEEIGFDWKTCICGGFPDCICTGKHATFELIKKWFREIHVIDITIITHYTHDKGIRKYRCGLIYLEKNVSMDETTIESFFIRPEGGEKHLFMEYDEHDDALKDGILAAHMLVKKRT